MSNVFSVLRTGHLYQVDMAAGLLKEAQLPHYLREESASGMRVAMPSAPAMGPGVWWSVLVPAERVEEARSILAQLPFEITTEPGIWDNQRGGEHGRFATWYKVFVWGLLAFIAWSMVHSLLRAP